MCNTVGPPPLSFPVLITLGLMLLPPITFFSCCVQQNSSLCFLKNILWFFFDITFSCLFPFCQQKITFQSKSHPTLYPHSRPQYKQTGFELGKISVVVVCCPHVISRRVPITSWVRYGSIRHFPAPWWASQLPLESWVFHPRGLDSGALIPMGQFLREWPVNPRLGHPLDDGRSTSLPSQGGEY